MISNKYFDHKNNKPIDVEIDAINYDLWETLDLDNYFTRHENGFFIFLQPSRINNSDEYEYIDPYKVEEHLYSDFHQRRLKCTIDLIGDVFGFNDEFKLLDLGCGQGHFTSKIKSTFLNVDVSAVDYSISAIKYASKYFDGIDFIVADAYDLPYSDEYFDIIVCNNIWEHVPDPVFLLEKIKKILKPNGHLILSTPSRFRIENILRIIMGENVTFMSQNHVTEYSVGQVYEQLKYGGFSNIKNFSPTIDSDLNPIWNSYKLRFIFYLIRSFLKKRGLENSLNSTMFFLAEKQGGS